VITSKLINASEDSIGDPNGDIYMGYATGDPLDTYMSKCYFEVSGCARIRITTQGSSVFNGVVTCVANGYGTTHDRIQLSRITGATSTFNDSVYLICKTRTTDIQVSEDPGTSTTFNAPVVVIREAPAVGSTCSLGNNGVVNFNGNVVVNNLSTGSINITNNIASTTVITGASTLASGKRIYVGALGFKFGTLAIRNFTQLGTTPQNITIDSTARLTVGQPSMPCIFNASTTTFRAGQIITINSTYNGITNLTKTGSTSNSCGGNSFLGAVTIENNGLNSFRFSATYLADVFSSTVNIINSRTSYVSMSVLYFTHYPDNVSVNNTSATTGGGIWFGENSTVSTLAAGKTISVGSGGYTNGYLYLYKFNTLGTNAQSLVLGTATTLRMGNQANVTDGCSILGNFIGTSTAVQLTGNTFSGTSAFTNNGTATGTTQPWGGNTFTGAFTLNSNGGNTIHSSQLFAADNFLSTCTINNASTGGVRFSRSFNTIYNDNIVVTATNTGSVGFGNNGGTSTLVTGKTITVGGLGFVGNTLELWSFTQVGITPQTIVLTGTTNELQLGTAINIGYGCTFNGSLNAIAPNFSIVSNIFNGVTNFTKIASGTANAYIGNNTFNADMSYVFNSSTTVNVNFSNIFGPDYFNGNSTLTSNCNNGALIMGTQFNAYFNGNVICNSTLGGIVAFGTGAATFPSTNGDVFLATGKTLSCGSFATGILRFRRFTQQGNTAQIITTTGTAKIEFGHLTSTPTFAIFEGDVTATSNAFMSMNYATFKQNVTLTSPNYNQFTNSVYNLTGGVTAITRTTGGAAGTNDDIGGNNVFYANVIFTSNGINRFRTGTTTYGFDDFRANLTLNNTGTGTVSFASTSASPSLIAGNLILSNTNTGTIIIGEQSSTTTSAVLTGGILSPTGNYTNGTVTFRFLNQTTGANNIVGTASAGTLSFINCTIAGNTTVNTTGRTVLTTNTFSGNNSFTSNNFQIGSSMALGNTFNTAANSFIKNGSVNDDANGGNTFNSDVYFESAGTGRLRLGTTSAPDDYNATATFNQVNTTTGVLAPAYDAVSTFSGNIVTAGSTLPIIMASATNGRVLLDGNVNQQINRTSGLVLTINKLTVNKPLGSITLNTRINVALDLTLTQGIINTTATNVLNMNNLSSTTIGNALSYINGPMNYDMALSATTRTLNFPIGKAANWRPAKLSAKHNVATSYTYTAEVFNANAWSLGYNNPPTISHVSSRRYWDINRSVTSTGIADPLSNLLGNQAVQLYYDLNDSVTDPANVTICKNTSTALTTWFDIGATGATVGTGSVSSTSIPTAFNSFSRFTLANKVGGTNPLPVQLLSFDAKAYNQKVNLTWSTATETNNKGFEIEKSTDGINFEYVTFVASQGSGNASFEQTYTAIDNTPYNGVSYYRLKQTDFNGAYEYSDIKAVEFNTSSFITLYPNPATTFINIKVGEQYTNATFKIINVLGTQMLNVIEFNTDNTASVNVASFVAGIYFLEINTGKAIEKIKFIIIK
jgi:hypothetical protein